MTDPAQERLASLQTERAYLLENNKHDRASQVDDEIEALLVRSGRARQETVQTQDPPETTDAPKARRGRPPGSRNKPKGPDDED